MNRIGKNIKKARSEKGYTQEQLAQKLCVTRNTISNYETGHSNPDIEMLQMLAEALETDPNTLIYGEKKEQSTDQSWRKEILKRVIWLAIAGGFLLIESCLTSYGKQLVSDTMMGIGWIYWPQLVLQPIAYAIIGSQIMALILQVYGKEIPKNRWTKVIFWVLIAIAFAWIIAVSAEWIRYEYAQWVYKQAPEEFEYFGFYSKIWGIGIVVAAFYKWLWIIGWGVYGMVLAILRPKRILM